MWINKAKTELLWGSPCWNPIKTPTACRFRRCFWFPPKLFRHKAANATNHNWIFRVLLLTHHFYRIWLATSEFRGLAAWNRSKTDMQPTRYRYNGVYMFILMYLYIYRLFVEKIWPFHSYCQIDFQNGFLTLTNVHLPWKTTCLSVWSRRCHKCEVLLSLAFPPSLLPSASTAKSRDFFHIRVTKHSPRTLHRTLEI